MTSLEQGFLAAGSSVTLSRKTTHSACPPLHMTSEPHTPPELTTWSTGSRQRTWTWPRGSADVPDPSECRGKTDLHGGDHAGQIPEDRSGGFSRA